LAEVKKRNEVIGVAYKVFSTKAKARQREAQMSPVAATESDFKSAILKSKSRVAKRPRPTRVHSRVTRARRGRWGENAVAFASVCHWQRRSGARLHSGRFADRLSLSAANARPKLNGSESANGQNNKANNASA
jgi:hypothetical protein